MHNFISTCSFPEQESSAKQHWGHRAVWSWLLVADAEDLTKVAYQGATVCYIGAIRS